MTSYATVNFGTSITPFDDTTILEFKELWFYNTDLTDQQVYEKWKNAIAKSNVGFSAFISKLRITVDEKREKMKRLYKLDTNEYSDFDDYVYDTVQALECVFSVN